VSASLFGLNVSAGEDPVGDAVRAEALGFDFVSAFDHLHGEAATYEPWTLLTAIAARTTRLKVATRVLAVPYRHPAVLAKMAETLDRLSGGRLILGLGGGHDDREFAAFGLPARSAPEKIEGLDEAVRVLRGLWGGDGMAPPNEVVHLRARVLDAAVSAGRNPDDILCAYNIAIRVEERWTESPETLSGSADEIVDQLVAFKGLGFGAFNFIPQGPAPDEQRDRLARDVIPHVRDA
jgi:alkanesulfonate monooxygenase SsuD/methylene tetrahydromethanopterin reductase-like flavin-dependent oxidoreductase (luciferase family)